MNKVCKLNAAIYRSFQKLLNQKLNKNKIDIGAGQSDFFFVIGNNQGKSQQEITDYLMVDKSTTTRVINSLQKKGYVKRKKDEEDGRIFRIYLTEAGEEVHGKISNIFKDVMNLSVEELKLEETDDLVKYLDIILNNILEEIK